MARPVRASRDFASWLVKQRRAALTAPPASAQEAAPPGRPRSSVRNCWCGEDKIIRNGGSAEWQGGHLPIPLDLARREIKSLHLSGSTSPSAPARSAISRSFVSGQPVREVPGNLALSGHPPAGCWQGEGSRASSGEAARCRLCVARSGLAGGCEARCARRACRAGRRNLAAWANRLRPERNREAMDDDELIAAVAGGGGAAVRGLVSG